MLLIIYTGPLKEIRQAVIDLGTASAAFIAYVHQVLETSHTFRFFYTQEKMDFEEMEKSSAIIRDAMTHTIAALNTDTTSSSERTFTEALDRLKAAIPGLGEAGVVGASAEQQRTDQ